MPGPFPRRVGGVLLHLSSLAGRDLIGTLGPEAYTFIDWLASSGIKVWQILPLTINGDLNSPYFSWSTFAGNVWLIDLIELVEVGLISREEADRVLHDHEIGTPVDFEELRRRKRPVLWSAANTLITTPTHPWRGDYDRYVATTDWLENTATFFAIRDDRQVPWWEWPDALRRGDRDAVASEQDRLADEIARWQAVLYIFDRQWSEVRRAAHQRGITILGDLPIYVADDSADVWAHQDQFRLDEAGQMVAQSGVPPDYFSETGQMWGNPLYRWDAMTADGYRWWIRRLRRALEIADLVRIDHFRALSAYWEIPADANDARDGRWVNGPGQHFLDALWAEFPHFPFIAEDLGTLDDEVYRLIDDNEMSGMRVVQFGFDGLPDNPHLPQAISARSIVYTGTHDNLPIAAWWEGLDDDDRRWVGEVYQHGACADVGRATWSMIEAVIASSGIAAIVPMQDLLVFGADARMNDPSRPTGNWQWRMPVGALSTELADSLRALVQRYGR
ncbi:MAG: 4-alpha-glucanotransferase [Ilumatobacter coccineus]|uniref:4-alpha-glucanotransferase n=1 Tax=Ilumatobacter coccineus TaxID=467094 RepID=A0A2G6K9E2_9ACTN|nr:MAG: 4-alpha-glucanotransferase [Ilumatobacter coccineus]